MKGIEVRKVLRRSAPVLLGVLLLAAGAACMLFMLGLEKPPAEAALGNTERALHVQALIAQPEDIPLTIRGFGEVRALRKVSIAPQVSGMVVDTHPELLVGGVIPEGEVLFRIEATPYEAALEQARAEAAQLNSAISRLQVQWATAKDQAQMHARTEELAQSQLGRVRQLLGEGIGSQFEVDQAEQAFVNARNTAEQARRSLELYPLQLAEARDALKAAQAQVRLAELDLERTRVKAPFTGRVRRVSVERGQLVAQGAEVLELADDSVLELSVPLDSLQVREALRFNGENLNPGGAWFTSVETVPCTIRWTEARENHTWQGMLHRVESYDEAARTITVAVRVDGVEAAASGPQSLPLVQGMFCEVEIPGRTLEGVYRLPASAVSFENNAHLALDQRLKTVPVHVARATDEYVLVSGGLSPGDIVVTTRLVNPMDHTLLELSLPGDELLPSLAPSAQ